MSFEKINPLELSAEQQSKISALLDFFPELNAKINLISRKDLDHLFEKHILHSLSIAGFTKFKEGMTIMDLGTGGGFPGIPLAIYFPETKFHLVDSIQKKIQCVEHIVKHLNLTNVTPIRERAENLEGSYDFIVSRAVAPVAEIMNWTRNRIRKGHQSNVANGWILLKGGNLTEELIQARVRADILPVNQFVPGELLQDKSIVYIRK